MKNAFALLLTAALLASCTPKGNTSTTDTSTTTGTTTTGTAADTTGTMPTDTTGTAATATTGAAATPDMATGTAADTSGTTAGATDTTETATMDTATGPIMPSTTDTTATGAAGSQSMEGKISTSDGTAQTFTMQQDGKDYNVTVTPDTTYQGQATSASDFFGTDRANADVTVEGTPSGQGISATSVTLK